MSEIKKILEEQLEREKASAKKDLNIHQPRKRFSARQKQQTTGMSRPLVQTRSMRIRIQNYIHTLETLHLTS